MCLPIDILVLPISDFDVILGMNWLNQYRVIIDCLSIDLSFDLGDKQLSFTLGKSKTPKYADDRTLGKASSDGHVPC